MKAISTLLFELARALLFVALALTAAGVCLLLGGCAGVHESRAVRGAVFKIEKKPDGTQTQTFAQGENPESESEFKQDLKDGVHITMGTAFAPRLAIPPAPDYTNYIALGICAVMLIGGIAVSSYGGPLGAQLGSRLILFGVLGGVVSLTVKDYGWLYAAPVAAIGLYCAWEKWRSFKTGFETPNPEITEEQRKAAAILAKKTTKP